MVRERKSDFSDEAPLPSLSYSIPHPHSSSHLFTSQDDSPPQNGKSFSLVFRAAEVQTAHFCMKYSWLYRAIFERAGDGGSETRMENSCHFDTNCLPNFHGDRALFQGSCTLHAPVGSLNLRNRQWEKWLISHLLCFQTVCILQFLSSSEHSLRSSLGAHYSNTAGNVSVAAS